MSHTRNGDTKHHNKKTQPTTPRPGQLAIKVHGLWWEVRSLTFSIWLVHEKCFIMYSRVKYYLQIHFKECEIYIEVLYDYIYHWMAYRRSPPLCGSIYLSIWILAICTLTVSHTNFQLYKHLHFIMWLGDCSPNLGVSATKDPILFPSNCSWFTESFSCSLRLWVNFRLPQQHWQGQ